LASIESPNGLCAAVCVLIEKKIGFAIITYYLKHPAHCSLLIVLC
jgi:hypothetical protein